MNIGIFALREIAHRVQHHTRLLGAGARVQIDQRLAKTLRDRISKSPRAVSASNERLFFGRVHVIALSARQQSVRTNSRAGRCCDLCHRIFQESMQQQAPRLAFRNPARPQVE